MESRQSVHSKGLFPHPFKGVALADGGGVDNAPALAGHFRGLGYDVALLLDSDKDPDDTAILAKLIAAQVEIFRWGRGYATEDMLFHDLPLPGVESLFDYTMKAVGAGSVLAAVNKERPAGDHIPTVEDVRKKLADKVVLDALAARAKGKKKKDDDGKETLHAAWFKDMDKADLIGRTILGPHLAKAETELQTVFSNIRAWIDGRS